MQQINSIHKLQYFPCKILLFIKSNWYLVLLIIWYLIIQHIFPNGNILQSGLCVYNIQTNYLFVLMDRMEPDGIRVYAICHRLKHIEEDNIHYYWICVPHIFQISRCGTIFILLVVLKD